MIRRTALRALTTVAVASAVTLPLIGGAQAVTPATTATAAASKADVDYAPATGDFSFFLDTDIAVRTVANAGQVRLVNTEFMRSHPRVEVRYGDPDHPGRARVVASATTLM